MDEHLPTLLKNIVLQIQSQQSLNRKITYTHTHIHQVKQTANKKKDESH